MAGRLANTPAKLRPEQTRRGGAGRGGAESSKATPWEGKQGRQEGRKEGKGQETRWSMHARRLGHSDVECIDGCVVALKSSSERRVSWEASCSFVDS